MIKMHSIKRGNNKAWNRHIRLSILKKYSIDLGL